MLDGFNRQEWKDLSLIMSLSNALYLLRVVNIGLSRMPQNMSLKIFFIVTPKEKLVGGAPPILLLVWHRLQNIIYESSRVHFHCRCHTRQSLFGYDNDKDLKGWFPMTRLMCGKLGTELGGWGALFSTLVKSSLNKYWQKTNKLCLSSWDVMM